VIALLQRVSRAEVRVADHAIAAIGQGLLVFVGIEHEDAPQQVARLCDRILGYRLFADKHGKMNLSVVDVGGAVLLVPQFTLAADTSKGNRPGFSRAAEPEEGRRLFEALVQKVSDSQVPVQSGQFGADMQVTLVNEGPVTFWLEVPPVRS